MNVMEKNESGKLNINSMEVNVSLAVKENSICLICTRVVALTFLILIILSTQSFAQRWQWPDKPENAKVLPKNITGQQLRGVMFGFTRALGVGCSHCHVGEKGKPLSEYDFPSDKKETKRTARIMFKMVKDINNKHLKKIGKDETNTLEVNCVTCHHGQSKPQTIEQILSVVISKEGVQAGIKKYYELRERYFGGFTYDFRDNPLNNLGYQLLGQDKLEDAIEIFKLNVLMNPDAANPYDSLGEAYLKAGKKWLAISNYSRSLELNPKNRNAVKVLEELTGEKLKTEEN